ncbi:MAG TPA: TlpA disulfide reductase family protein [Bacilli bacterium]|nr:TlpA disulfide reductase family protein [Bacilli bacterium]
MKKWIIGGAIVVVLAVAAFLSTAGMTDTDKSASETKQGASSQHATARPQSGYPAPDFTLTGFDGKTVKLSDLRGKPVVINFWASWCGPCRNEMPDLQATYEQFRDRVTFYGVNLTSQDTEEKARAFVKEMGLTFPMLLDAKGEASDAYGLASIPSTFAIDANGVIKEVRLGQMTKPMMTGMLERLVSE